MKKLIIPCLSALLIACGQAPASEDAQTLLKNTLEDLDAIESVEKGNPIVKFKEAAEASADETQSLTKNNIKDVLEMAQEFDAVFIVVEDHTLVKLEDLGDCSNSGSWAACMPKGEGYIKRGDLVEKEDYINNIIGTPDDQQRTVYFFRLEDS